MRYWRRNLYVVATAQFVSIMGFSAIWPFLPYYIQELGVTDVDQVAIWAGLMTAGSAITMVVFSPIWGSVGDRYGRKLMLVRAALAAAITLGLMGLARNPQQLLAIRMIQGCFSGTISAATTLVATSLPRDKTGYGLGLMQTAVFGGASFGPLVGGFLADRIGYRPVFWITAPILLLSALGVLLFVREDFDRDEIRSKEKRGQTWVGMRNLLRSPGLFVVLSVSMAVRGANESIKPILPLFIQTLIPAGAKPASIAGSISALTAITAGLAAVFVGREGDRLGYRKVLLFCTICAGLLLIPQAFVQRTWHLFVLRGLVGACIGGTFPMVNAVIATTTESARQGTAYGLKGSGDSLGRGLGPMLGAAVAASMGLRAAFISAAVLFGLVAVMVTFLMRERPSTEASGVPDG